jgi:HSP20 family molecular chaperone IbpA
MSSRSAATPTKDPASSIPINAAKDHVHRRVKERIAGRAYDIFQQRGNHHGEDMRHWLQAESEILNQVPEIRESGSWYTINVPLRGFAASEVQISLEPRYTVVAAEKEQVAGGQPGPASDVFVQALFTSAKWPHEVDPATASAYLKNGVLTLTVKQANADSTDHENRAAQGKK